MLPEQQQRILGYFIEEAKDHLNTIEQGLLTLQATINDRELLKEVYRAAHSVKGGAGMLSLQSIQKTSHLLEDCFKLLEESPVQVDQKLESLFWQVFDALKELLEQLQGPFGLTEDVSNNVMSSVELVSSELRQHLEKLVSTSAAKVTATKQKDSQQELLISAFKQDVMEQLRQMLQLFKPPAWPNSRTQLQGCCDTLAQMGNRFELSSWCGLIETARSAIGNSENTCQTLAPIVIKEIKAAQELVLSGKAAEICIGEQLQALLPVTPAEEEDLDFGDLFLEDSATSSESDIVAATSEEEDADLFAQPLEFTEPELPTTSNLGRTGRPARSIAGRTPQADSSETQTNPRFADRHGPEVGAAELNTLADLFQEAVDLDDNWQEEETFGDTTVEPVSLETVTDLETNSEFADLFDDISAEEQATNDDILDFLNDDFEEKTSPANSADLTDFDLDDTDDIFGTEKSREAEDNLTELFADLPEESATWDEVTEINSANLTAQTGLDIAKTSKDFAANSQLEEFDLANLFDSDEELLDFGEETAPSNELEVTEAGLTDDFGLFDEANEEVTENQEADTFDFDVSNDEFWSDETPEAIATTAQLDDNWFAEAANENNQEIPTTAQLDDNWFAEAANENNQEIPTIEDLSDLSFDAFDPFADDTSASNQQSNEQFTWDVSETTDNNGSLDDLFALGTEDLGNFTSESDFGADLFGTDTFTESTNLASTANVSPVDEFTTHIQEFDNEIGAFLTEEPEMEWLTDNSSEASLELFESTTPTTEESFDFGSFDEELTTDSELATDNFLADTADDMGFDWGAALTEEIPETSEATDWQDLAESPTEESFDFDGLTAEEPDSFAELPTEESFDFDGLTAEESEEVSALDFDSNSLDSFDNFDAELPGELDTGDSAGDWDFTADTGETDEFGGLAAMLNEEEAPAVNQGEEVAEFADLEAMLDNEEFASAAAPDNNDAADDLDFADLEAMLGDESPSIASVAIPAAAATAAVAAAAVVSQKSDDDIDFSDLESLVAEIDKKPGSPAANKPRPSQSNTPKRLTRGILEQTMKVPVKQMDNLSNLVGELVVNRNTLEQEQERLRQFLDNLLTQVQQLSDVGARMQDLYERSLLEASLLASRRRDRYYSSNYRSYDQSDSDDDSSNKENSHQSEHSVDYDPLEMDRFTSFHTISQEMIELIVRVRESTADIEFVTDETEQVCRQFRQVTTQLQEGLTRARMVPFGEIERVFPLIRYVRDKAAEFGKQAEIKIEGRETLIDKLILEHFSDPLKHLVNNAIAHGIETPEVRQKAGKSPTGKITIKAFHQGNQTVISFSDDGGGINVDRVKQKAIEKRLISRADAEGMTRQEIYQLIYHPGFSTKDEADLLSGKGVGMDVVLTSLSEIRGTITTDSNQGKGTTFTIRLPLTLSICKALCCLSDKARIAFPMDGVEDALDIPKDRVQINAEGNPCIPWRDTTLPFKPLSELLTYNRQLGRAGVYGGTKEEDVISIVVLRSPNNLIALQVDQVLGEQEIVIKQLEGPIPKPLGIAGATVQGDGRIMPIADVLELVDLSLGVIRNEGGKFWDQDANATSVPDQPKSDPTVLIVDDSITVRELLSMTFNKTGYRVEQARDGQEAWDKLKSGLPCDIIFCDIEMPRMDGLELLSRLQKDPELNHLPVAMLTSRGADKHRQMAVQLGASGYFTKPYLEDSLLDAASRMLKGEKLVTSNAGA
ncbi:response regulator [Floridanema evergladense]|uniref:histidine kinase n=1 Tax=Floridaenema evergladense BLCC-F167 TaxID=3153639 RepID=A0ABV4WVU9_9CYAN